MPSIGTLERLASPSPIVNMQTRVLTSRAAIIALGLSSLAPIAAASDVLVIVRGIVEREQGQGITSGPFANVQVGDSYIFVGGVDRPPPGSPSTGSVLSNVRHETFYLEMGGASVTDSYATTPGVATIYNDAVDNGSLPFDAIVMGLPILDGGLVGIYYIDRNGIDFNTNNITQLAGTYTQSFPSAFVTVADPVLFNSALQCRINSLEIINRSQLGQALCSPATPNSTGVQGELVAEGFDQVFANELVLRGTHLPIGQFSMLVGSTATTPPATVSNSAGFLSLVRPVGSTGPAPDIGTVIFQPNLEAMPQQGSFVAAMAGETWTFQGWHRDVMGGAVTSNFTTAVSVTLQ